MLRSEGVAEATLEILVANGLTTPLAIMQAYDAGLSDLGIKKGPRVKILKNVKAALLPDEDEAVRDLLEDERFQLGKYRARCAEEQIDLEALGFFADETDAVVVRDLGVDAEDLATFRQAVIAAQALG
jgi:hypothetical protein